jgi:hypothetical protein
MGYVLARYFIPQPKIIILWKESYTMSSVWTTLNKMWDINKVIKHNAIVVGKSKHIQIFGYCYLIVLTSVYDIEHLLFTISRMVENLWWSVICNLLWGKLIKDIESAYWFQFQHFVYVWCLVSIFDNEEGLLELIFL